MDSSTKFYVNPFTTRVPILIGPSHTLVQVNEKELKMGHTVEPLNKGHLGTQAAVPYSEVVPYWEVRDKTVIL